MDINNDGSMVDLADFKCEIVVRSFGQKNDLHTDALASVKWKLDEIKVRRLDLNLWKVNMKVGIILFYCRIVSQYVYIRGQGLIGDFKYSTTLINDYMTASNDMFCP